MEGEVLTPRSGFVETLGRRAAFTRRHRGAFAAPLDGALNDSSGVPAAWHAGDRVLFTWHRADTIGFAAFDAAGRPIGELQALGAGRWPRIAADGRRHAVAWVQDDSVAVRTHDGQQWHDPIALAGREGAIAFAPDGALVAATADGVWRLDGGSLARVRAGSFSRPALAVDRDVAAHVAWERDSDVWCDDERIGSGKQPSIVSTADSGIWVAWVSGDDIHVCQRTNGAWAAATIIPMRAAAWPTLALEGDRVRLTCLGAVPFGPDALWLVRLPDPAPILMPSVFGNVTHAWLMHRFELRGPRSSYRPHDVQIAFNGSTVQAFENDVAEGRYLFRLDPRNVRSSPGRPAPNTVEVTSRHMNGGHYVINNDFTLIVRTPWSERWGFATSESELLADRPENVNEDRPDLVLLANTLRLPVEAPEPGPVPLDVTVLNIGEAASDPAELVLTAGERELFRTAVPPLVPGDDVGISVPFDWDGQTNLVELRIVGTTRDFSAASKVLPLHLWVRRAETSTYGGAPTGDTAAHAAEPTSVSALPAGEPVADFTLPLAIGSGVIRLSDFAGKVVLLNWWRTSCGWSQAEAPKLVDLYGRHRDRGFEIMGISDDTADTVGAIEAYRERHRIAWPLMLNDQAEFLREVVPHGRDDTPANYLVTRSGRLVSLGLDRSDQDWARLEETVVAALNESWPPASSIPLRELPLTPPLAGTNLDGRNVALGDFAARPLVVNFFNTETCDWAGGVLADLDRRYAARGLRVLGVNLFDDDETVRACVRRHNIAFPVIRGTPEVQRDWISGSSAWATFFVTPDGRMFKSILTSIERGLEGEVFWRYAEFLLEGTARRGQPR